MTALEKAPTILTRVGAEKITARISRTLESADRDLARAYEGRVWEPLGHASWEEWCAAELPQLQHIKLSIPARVERAVELRLVGASERAIAAANNVSVGTAHTDLQRGRDAGLLDAEPTSVASLDSRRRPARQQPATGATARAEAQAARGGLTLLLMEAWQRLDAAGGRGLTSLELERKTRWRHGRVSSLLHRLEKAGAAVRDREQVRDGYTAYVALPLPAPQD